MRILITGVSGFAGSVLARRLARGGEHELHGLSRAPARVSPALELAEIHAGDALSGDGLGAALEGMQVAYYLIHSMESTAEGTSFSERDRLAAERFGRAAAAAGVERIVYLGGLVPAREKHSVHLASRLEVERALLEAVPGSVALRASIVIGARSRSFRFLVRLVERLPVLALPAWRDFRTQPIDERDVVEYLAAAATAPGVGGRTLDVAGPDTLTYGEMITRIADLMLVGRPSVGLGFNLTAAASTVAARIAGEQLELVGPLMESLDGDLLADDTAARELLAVRLHSFQSAVERGLREWEAHEQLRAR